MPLMPFECTHCSTNKFFKTSQQFALHLRNDHCSKEGGSYVCRYGPHNLCKTLPLEGVSDRDYEEHVKKFHLNEQGTSLEPSSSQPSLVKDTAKHWTMNNSSVNLAAALNDPRKTRREVQAFFTRHWGESFTDKVDVSTPMHLPKITSKHFEEYLSVISRRQRSHRKDSSKKQRSHKSSESISQISPKTTVGDVVPAMFFSSKFSLEDPQCFEALFLTENLDIVPEHIPDNQSSAAARREARLKPNKIMQEKLSYYLDAVEIQISRHIASQSGSFFRAMTSHDELQSSLHQTREAAGKLRANIKNLDEKLCVRSLQILHLQATRTNHDAVLKKLELVSTVRQTQSMVQTLLHSCDFLGALELISTTQSVLKEELSGLVCFRHLSAQLNELESLIGKMLNEEFVKIIKTELNRSISEQIDENMLSTIVLGLLRVGETRFLSVIEEESSISIKNLIREMIRSKITSEDSSTDFENPQGTLADQMRKMDFKHWFDLWQILLQNLLLLIKKIKSINDVLLELIDLSLGKSSKDDFFHRFPLTSPTDIDITLNESDYANLIDNLNEFLTKVGTYAQERCVRVMVARAKDGFLERLSIDEFLSIENSVEQFSAMVDELADRKIFVLRACLQAQTLKIIQKFHDDRKNKLGNILDLEHWKQADVPLLFQEIVDEFEKIGKLRDVQVVSERNSKPTRQFLTVKGEKFVVIGTGLIIIQIISQYCQLVEKLPAQAAELLTRLVELLKNFNSRTCQLILGAGALQLVGLKTIGARNLALASRCLQLILHFVPTVRRHFESYLPSNQTHLSRHVVQMEKDYHDHIEEIFNKLLLIMETNVGMTLKKWDLKPPAPSPAFQQLIKQMKRFYENVADVLPANQLQKLYLRIHDKFKSSLRIQLKQLKITPHDGALYSLVCSEFSFYMENLKSLPSCSAIDDSLQDVMIER